MQAMNDIAVVGIAYKLPEDVETDVAFWEVLEGAKNLSGDWPAGRMNAAAHPDPRNGKVREQFLDMLQLAGIWICSSKRR
jgi:acyl transferase domain-containing protein